jgi:hypothetical protein
MVWLPVLPPMLATIGINAARAASCTMMPSNWPITREVMNAVTRLTASDGQRFLAPGGARKTALVRPSAEPTVLFLSRAPITGWGEFHATDSLSGKPLALELQH